MSIFINFISVLVTVIFGGCVFMCCAEIYDTCRILASIESEEEKTEKRETIIANTIVGVILIVLYIGGVLFVRSLFTHQYNDVKYSIENVEILFGVEIESVEEEKGKEKKYQLLLSDKNKEKVIHMSYSDLNILSDKIVGRGNYESQIRIILTETDYYDLIGDGNNLFRTNMSILRIETEKYCGIRHYMNLYRLVGLSECGEFTDEEAKDLSEFFFDNVNEGKCKTLPEDDSVADMIHECLY